MAPVGPTIRLPKTPVGCMHATSVNNMQVGELIRYTSVHYSSCASMMGARSYLESCQRLQWASKITCKVRNLVGHTRTVHCGFIYTYMVPLLYQHHCCVEL